MYSRFPLPPPPTLLTTCHLLTRFLEHLQRIYISSKGNIISFFRLDSGSLTKMREYILLTLVFPYTLTISSLVLGCPFNLLLRSCSLVSMSLLLNLLFLPWRSLMGCCMNWIELFKEEVFLRDIKGLYQLKKLYSLSLVYLTLWTSGNNPVTSVLALKNGFKHRWFIT